MVAVFTLIDALGWTYLKERAFLPQVLTYRAEVRTVLGFSSAAIPAILSGKLPRDSGHWNLFYYDPENSPFKWVRYLGFLPSSVLNSRMMRRAVRIISQRLSRFGGYFQIYGVPVELLPYFDICQKKDIYQPGGVPASIFDYLKERGVSYRAYSYHQFRDSEIIQMARRDLRARKFSFYFLYLAELDAFLHHRCHDSEGIDREIDRYETWLLQVYSEAVHHNSEVAFFVFSDHGMTPKQAGYDLIKQICDLGLKMPDDYIALYDSTMARFWFFNDQAREVVSRRLEGLSCGHILRDEEKAQLGIDFPDNRYGDLVFLMNPGVMIEPSYFGALAPEGMHGFHPDDRYSSAAFLSNRKPARPVRTLTDVHDVMMDMAEAVRS
jgi:hypothetical protein